MKRVKFYIILIIFGFNLCSYAQDSLFSAAKKSMEQERWIEAQNLLLQGLKTTKDTLLYSYELAWAYYSNKEYSQSIKTLQPFVDNQSATSEVYQLLGNAWDEYGNPYKAADVYKEGLNKYPQAGNLFLELGNLKYKQGDYKDALYWYEKGIEAEPLFSSNYYRAAKVFFMSTEMVWGILYGEMFMLLENDTERSKQMSKELLEAYFSCLRNENDKPVADFNNNIIVYSDSYERKNLLPKIYNSIMQECCNNIKHLNFEVLINIRKNFILKLYKQAPDFDNIIFDYEKQLINNGMFEAFNYYLFAYGETKTAKNWITQHKQQWDNFNKWYKQNPIKVSENNFFSRYNME